MFPLGCPGEVSASNNSNSNNMGSLTVDATPDYMDIQPPAEEGHLGFFSCLPDELKYDILYVLVDGAFPFGPHRAHCLTSPEELKQQAWKANFSEMSYALQSMRRHVRHLNVLATTTKQWYKLIEDQCHVLYHVLREHMALDSPSHFWNRIEPLLSVSTVAANVLSVYPEALKQWFVAAGRLCLWPQGRRTFVGFATPDLQQKAHQGRMTVEEYATALCSGTFADEVAEEKQNSHDERRRLRPDDILFRIDPSRVNFGRYLYVRHSWQVFPTLFASIEQQNQWPVPLKQGQEAHPRPLKVLPRTVETLTRLVAADAPVYPQEEAYWAIVRGRAGGLIDPKPRQQQKKTPPSAQTQTTSSASTRSSQDHGHLSPAEIQNLKRHIQRGAEESSAMETHARFRKYEGSKKVCANPQCSASSAVAILLCGHCKSVHYCSAACQRQHWPVHKQDCGGKEGVKK